MKCKALRKLISVILVAVAVLSAFPYCVNAAEPVQVMPRLNNGADAVCDFYIDSYGQASVYCDVTGTANVTTGINIEIQLQRKGLLWWSDVDDCYWSDYFSGHLGSMVCGKELTKTGKYRAVFTITVSGTGGADDVIEETLTYEY